MVPSKSKGATPLLRIAAVARVSTERQEEKGESLPVQREGLEDSAKTISGKIVEWYGGQEHAMPGYEKAEIDRLISDAAKGKWDAVMVDRQDRWSRDNAKSKEGIKAFRANGIRFFVRTVECDLDNAMTRCQIGVTAEFNELSESIKKEASIKSRLKRARNNSNAAGNLPVGRTFDKKTKKWGIKPEAKAMMEDVAKRYLAGEAMPVLAEEYGVNHSTMHKNLTRRCGDTWVQRFRDPDLKIDEEIVTTIPRLLPERTIKAVLKKVEANKTFDRNRQSEYFKNKYLLSGLIFCEHCGYGMFGQPGEWPYYRHAHMKRVKECTCSCKSSVNVKLIEENVIAHLFDVFGNPKAVESAIRAAIPNPGQIADLHERQARLQEDLTKTIRAKERVMDLLDEDDFDKDDFRRKKGALREKEDKIKEQLRVIAEKLEQTPASDLLAKDPARLMKRLQSLLFPATRLKRIQKMPVVETTKRGLNSGFGLRVLYADNLRRMSWDDKRELLKAVFGGQLPGGRRPGVYIEWFAVEKRSRKVPNWKFSIRGTIQIEDLKPLGSEALHRVFADPVELEGDPQPVFKRKKKRVTASASR